MSATSAAAATQLGRLAERTRPVALAGEQLLPVLPALEGLVPNGGLRRGSTVSVSGQGGAAGATSLALALVAGPSAAGSWTAAVGLPSLGLVAAAELGVSLGRIAMIAAPPDGDGVATVVATLVDAFDVVLVGTRLRPGDARRLTARAKERGAVLVHLSAGADREVALRLTVVRSEWQGLGEGHGHLQARRVVVEAGGRGAASRPRRMELWLPGFDGSVSVVGEGGTVLPLRETFEETG